MSRARILGEPQAAANNYHVTSRIIEGRFIFDEIGKEKFRQLLEAYSEMTGIEVFTWCCMDNHFHILLQVPNAEESRSKLDDEEILRRLSQVMQPERVDKVRETLDRLRDQPVESDYLEYREQLLARMYDLSAFMRELKQRFSQWYNRRVERKGPLWEDRFQSVLLEDDEDVLLMSAAYIDLNPVRVGLVEDPKDYRWSGYGEAVTGERSRRLGLMRVLGYEDEDKSNGEKMDLSEWGEYQAQYRRSLYAMGEERGEDPMTGAPGRAGVTSEAAEEVARRRGELSVAEVARVRVRYFTESVAFGSREWVEEVFKRNREKLKVKRNRGARELKVKGLERWRGLIDLRGAL